ncbi:MAG: M23 family metallopeptidase [Acidobacteriota bacterium]
MRWLARTGEWRAALAEPRLRAPWRAALFVFAQALVLYLAIFSCTSAPTRAPEPPPSTPPGDEIEALRQRGLLVPVEGVARSELRGSFGAPRGQRKHLGLDILAPRGTPVVAVESGTIARVWTGRLAGRALHLVSSDGRYLYFYAHLEGYARGLRAGREVRAGEVLGFIGDTGNATTPHLHFGIRSADRGDGRGQGPALDPYRVLRPR